MLGVKFVDSSVLGAEKKSKKDKKHKKVRTCVRSRPLTVFQSCSACAWQAGCALRPCFLCNSARLGTTSPLRRTNMHWCITLQEKKKHKKSKDKRSERRGEVERWELIGTARVVQIDEERVHAHQAGCMHALQALDRHRLAARAAVATSTMPQAGAAAPRALMAAAARRRAAGWCARTG